jgi:arylsulfatase A-like enzyme
MDVLPTLAKLAGAELPTERIIDGHDIWPLLSGELDAKSPYDVFYYYWLRRLDAVRSGKWKLHFPHDYPGLTGTPGKDGQPGGYTTEKTELALYDLESDIGETKNIADEHPDIVERLQALAEKARDDLGDAHQNRKGKNVRPPGRK